MITMLEKMASRIAEELGEGERPDGLTRVEGVFDMREVARAALQAIREPDEAICRAGEQAGSDAVSAADQWAAHDCNVHESQPPAMFRAMITMLEKMARAMRDSEPGMEGKSWLYWLPSARAALLALREPPESAVAAGLLEWPDSRVQSPTDGLPVMFTAMIDAILAEPDRPLDRSGPIT